MESPNPHNHENFSSLKTFENYENVSCSDNLENEINRVAQFNSDNINNKNNAFRLDTIYAESEMDHSQAKHVHILSNNISNSNNTISCPAHESNNNNHSTLNNPNRTVLEKLPSFSDDEYKALTYRNFGTNKDNDLLFAKKISETNLLNEADNIFNQSVKIKGLDLLLNANKNELYHKVKSSNTDLKISAYLNPPNNNSSVKLLLHNNSLANMGENKSQYINNTFKETKFSANENNINFNNIANSNTNSDTIDQNTLNKPLSGIIDNKPNAKSDNYLTQLIKNNLDEYNLDNTKLDAKKKYSYDFNLSKKLSLTDKFDESEIITNIIDNYNNNKETNIDNNYSIKVADSIIVNDTMNIPAQSILSITNNNNNIENNANKNYKNNNIEYLSEAYGSGNLEKKSFEICEIDPDEILLIQKGDEEKINISSQMKEDITIKSFDTNRHMHRKSDFISNPAELQNFQNLYSISLKPEEKLLKCFSPKEKLNISFNISTAKNFNFNKQSHSEALNTQKKSDISSTKNLINNTYNNSTSDNIISSNSIVKSLNVHMSSFTSRNKPINLSNYDLSNKNVDKINKNAIDKNKSLLNLYFSNIAKEKGKEKQLSFDLPYTDKGFKTARNTIGSQKKNFENILDTIQKEKIQFEKDFDDNIHINKNLYPFLQLNNNKACASASASSTSESTNKNNLKINVKLKPLNNLHLLKRHSEPQKNNSCDKAYAIYNENINHTNYNNSGSNLHINNNNNDIVNFSTFNTKQIEKHNFFSFNKTNNDSDLDTSYNELINLENENYDYNENSESKDNLSNIKTTDAVPNSINSTIGINLKSSSGNSNQMLFNSDMNQCYVYDKDNNKNFNINNININFSSSSDNKSAISGNKCLAVNNEIDKNKTNNISNPSSASINSSISPSVGFDINFNIAQINSESDFILSNKEHNFNGGCNSNKNINVNLGISNNNNFYESKESKEFGNSMSYSENKDSGNRLILSMEDFSNYNDANLNTINPGHELVKSNDNKNNNFANAASNAFLSKPSLDLRKFSISCLKPIMEELDIEKEKDYTMIPRYENINKISSEILPNFSQSLNIDKNKNESSQNIFNPSNSISISSNMSNTKNRNSNTKLAYKMERYSSLNIKDIFKEKEKFEKINITARCHTEGATEEDENNIRNPVSSRKKFLSSIPELSRLSSNTDTDTEINNKSDRKNEAKSNSNYEHIQTFNNNNLHSERNSSR